MSIGGSLTSEIKSWGVLIMFIVILSVILLKFKDTAGYTTDLNTTITTSVSAFSEPRNWVGIIIIAVIGIYLMKKFGSKKAFG